MATPLNSGIPIFGGFERLQAEQDERIEKWRAEATGVLDGAILDWDKATAGKNINLDFAIDRDTARKQGLVGSYIFIANRGREFVNPRERDLIRDQIAAQKFEGRGVGDDLAFYGEVEKETRGRNDLRTLRRDLLQAANVNAALQVTDFFQRDPGGFSKFLETAKAKPGYKFTSDAELLERWNESTSAYKAAVEPFARELDQVVYAMKNGDGAGAAFRAYSTLSSDERPAFMASLKMIATSLPPEEQPSFWNNLSKKTGRDLSSLARGLGRTLVENMEKEARESVAWTPRQEEVRNAMIQSASDAQLAMNFAADVRKIQEEVYDPVKAVLGDYIPGWVEEGLYSAPGAVGTSAAALYAPGGLITMYGSMKGVAFESMRENLMSAGVEDGRASELAREWSGPVGVVQTGLERVGASAILGKLPFFDEALTRVGNAISNKALRFTARGLVIGAEETLIENAQDLVPYVTQEIGAALEKDVPGVRWRGDGGLFDGYWAKTGSTFVAILPLALLGASGGVNVDQRVKVWRDASDTEIIAVTGDPEGVPVIRSEIAKGLNSGALAIESALKNSKPNSAAALAAVEKIGAGVDRARAAVEMAQNEGIVPSFVATSKGFSVLNQETGEVVGTASSPTEALRLADAHGAGIAESDAEYVTYLATQLEGMQALAGSDSQGTRETSFDFGPERTEFTTVYQSALAANDAEAVFKQAEARGEMAGQVEITRQVLGQSVTDFNQRQRRTVNRLNQGSSLSTVVHEERHGFYREARAAERLTRGDTLSILRAIDAAALAGRKTKDGADLRLLPDIADDQVTEKMLDEAVAEWGEAELRMTRGKRGASRPLPARLLDRNYTAIAKQAPEAASKWRAFYHAVRAFFGLAFQRAVVARKAIKEGRLDEAQLREFNDRLFGLREQDQHDAEALRHAEEFLGGELMADAPFALGPSRGRPTSEVIFPVPIIGLSGANLLSYRWQSKLEEQANIEGEMKLRRVSDWEQSVSNAETGKDIVHQFVIEVKGQEKVVSLESALALMGFLPVQEKSFKTLASSLKTFAKNQIKVRQLEGLVERFRADEEAVNAMPIPQIETKPYVVDYGPQAGKEAVVYEMGDVQSFPDWNNAGPNKGLLVQQWRMSQMKNRGWKSDPEAQLSEAKIQLKRSAKKLEGQTSSLTGGSFSLAGSRMAELLGRDALDRIKDPQRRIQSFSRMARAFEKLRVQQERIELESGSKRLRKSLKKEAAMREVLRREELENETYARFLPVLTDDDLTKLKSQPGHSVLSDPKSPLRGRLMSKSAALKRHPDLFAIHRPGDYDGSEAVSRSLFGGDLMPDQAAQEMFEQGLIKEPTPDAMWELLEAESRTVEKMRGYLDLAKDELRQARQQAKDETNAWLREQGAVQDTVYSPEEEIRRALALYDGMLAVVPPEIRGRLGGHSQLARLGTNEARLKFLKERMDRLDRELEDWLKAQFSKEMFDLLERAKPQKDQEAGQKPRGKIGADMHELFVKVREAMSLSAADTTAEVARLEALLEARSQAGDLTPEEEAHLTLQAALVPLVGNWINADAARREAAVVEATKIYKEGYDQYKEEMKRRSASRNARRDRMMSATKKFGLRDEREDRKEKDEGTKTGRLASTANELRSYEALLHQAFGLNSQDAAYLAEWERRAAYAKEDSIQNKMDLLDDLFINLAGSQEKGEKLRWEMMQRSIVVDGKKFSPLQAITATLMWRQEDGRRHMEGHKDDVGRPAGKWHYDEKFMDKLEAELSPEAKAIRLHLSDQYAAEYDRLNAVYRQLYGVSLPKHKLYSPLTVVPAKAQGGMVLDPASGFSVSGNGFTPGTLKTRSFDAVAEPDFQDALQVYIAHTRQMEHWMAYAPFATEAAALINSRDLGNSVSEAAGAGTINLLRKWGDYFAQGGVRDANVGSAMYGMWNRIGSRFAAMALVGKVSVLAIQATQLGAAWGQMPTGAYISRFAKLMTGRLQWGAALDSDYIQRRKRQMPALVQQAMDGLRSSKPGKLKYAVRKMGETIAGADALFTAGTFAMIYDYQISQARKLGISEANAHKHALAEAERLTEQVAQPTRAGTRSWMEISSSHPAQRILFSFASEARQKFAFAVLGHSDRTPAEKARAYAVTWLVGGVVSSVIRSAIRDMKDDDDDWFDERNWDPGRMALQSLAGPLGGVPFMGDLIEAAIFEAGGEYMPSGTMLDTGKNAVGAFKNVPKWFEGDRDMDGVFKDVQAMLTAAGLADDRVASATSIVNVARDLFAFGKNLVPE